MHSGDDFSPIPLYKQLKNQPHLSQDLIKWQENWQACDQLQMNGSALEKEALNEIAEVNSTLSKHGRYLAAEIEKESGIPTYYYLYRVGGHFFRIGTTKLLPAMWWRLDIRRTTI